MTLLGKTPCNPVVIRDWHILMRPTLNQLMRRLNSTRFLKHVTLLVVGHREFEEPQSV